jgi:outer membrane lipoprotein-sorting protein
MMACALFALLLSVRLASAHGASSAAAKEHLNHYNTYGAEVFH